MNKKEIKQDGEQAPLTKTSLLKIESREGQIIYIFTKLFDHPIRQQIKFAFGQINVFIEKQGIKCFKSEMNSMECLNQGIDWDQKYFDKIITCLERPDKDFSYSFKRSEGNEQVPCDYVLILSEKVHKLNEVILLRVYLIENPSFSTLDHFYRVCKEIQDKKEIMYKSLEEKFTNLTQQRQKLQTDIEFISNQSQQREKEILKKFVLLLNEKKKEICRLNQINGLITNQIIEEEQQNNNNYINVDDFFEEKQIPVKKQYEEQAQSSQFPVSQIDQFLFTQDTQFKKDLREIPSKKTKL
ncbi:unnamed protein product (macronuclear) [Paramecium tetraurelia]|uniref:Spindle assembly abnormal protein 6 N-terminal domain-containing protein n=1 Tax=Paramecium tetraurelia TaxID=5888 RepID=A0BK43_PARTE|nr:uncharacterized protein GSPATT00029540001 [Paramecium tetraurelia]CAK58910.1 unnamed protein product [Paramecium tetraurelia]|eukprot:XP_001426308.1 hypothetical protein (macronuclear) [Paramecium tetraurelia strain d4-2]